MKKRKESGDHGSRATGSQFIPYPFALMLFKHKTRARPFALFPLSALALHPCLTRWSRRRFEWSELCCRTR